MPVGRVGTTSDNALAESITELFGICWCYRLSRDVSD